MKGRWRKVIVSVIASTVLTAVLAVVIWRMSLTRANNRTIEAIRRAGYPTSKAELNAWYAEVPADKNAALLLTQPMEALRIRSFELQKMKMPGRGERLTNAALVQAYVETNRATLELIRAALERPQSRYSINLWQGAYADLQHVEPLRDLARLADYAALLAQVRQQTTGRKDFPGDCTLVYWAMWHDGSDCST